MVKVCKCGESSSRIVKTRSGKFVCSTCLGVRPTVRSLVLVRTDCVTGEARETVLSTLRHELVVDGLAEEPALAALLADGEALTVTAAYELREAC